MRILARSHLLDYSEKVPATASHLKAWIAEVKNVKWQNPHDVKATFGTASILKAGRVVFNICGNNHRLVVWINYASQLILVKFIGTHKEYDKIDADTVEWETT